MAAPCSSPSSARPADSTYGAYLRKTDGSPATRLGDGFTKALSPDLAWALVLQPEPAPHLALLPVGPGQARTVDIPLERFHQVGFLPSGRRIVLAGNERGHGTRLFIQDLAGTAAPRAISPEGIIPGVPLLPVSADEKWVAALAADGQVHLYPIDGGEPRTVAGTTALVPIRLSASGGRLHLYAARLDQVPTQIQKIDVADGTRTTFASLAPADVAGIHGLPSILLSADGKVAYCYARFLSEMYQITGAR